MAYACPVIGCHGRYRRRGDLKVHVIKKHFDFPPGLICRPKSTKIEKKYPCPYDDCPRGYGRATDLKRHLEKKHETDELFAPSLPETPYPSEADPLPGPDLLFFIKAS